jgi:hypothetical protein
MKKLLLILILSFFSAQSFAGSCPDGSEPVKSISADGTYFVYNCGGGNEQASSSTANSSNVNSNTKALAGIDIENDPEIDFFRPPMTGYSNFQIKDAWVMRDFNNDGYVDVIYIGSMKYNDENKVGEDTAGTCGGGACKGNKPLPSLYLGDKKGKLTYAPELLIDNREDPGMSLAKQILVADYNNDGFFDFYIADHALGTHDGIRDSYFLSQSNGTWVESSKTHLSHPNFKVFDHGAATGDIDNDGDMDVVITNTGPTANGTNTRLWCLMNDGTGFLKKRKCGGRFGHGIELGDMDGDGDLDIVQGGLENSDCKRCNFTGIVWNNGGGNFPKQNTTSLPQHKKKWSTVPEVSLADLDNDSDLDIVYSRAGHLYVGTSVQIIENLGNKKFKDHGIFPLVEAPNDFIPTHEGNIWNDFIVMIKFRDLDKDGNIDLYLMSMSPKTNGTVLLNQGDFNFLYYKLGENGELSPITDIEKEKAERIAELKKKQEAEKAKRLVKERENKKNNFKYSSRNFKTQYNLLFTQFSQVCDNVKREFNSGDFKSRTKKNTYFFISRDSNGKDCHYEWSSNEGNALRRCKQNNETDGQCTIYALGDNIVWGNPKLYKELTGRK